mgnify:CR=1 FL=1
MLISIHPTNPQPRQLAIIKDCLESGGIIAYPTDTIYGLGCDIFHPEAVEKICAIKKVSPEKKKKYLNSIEGKKQKLSYYNDRDFRGIAWSLMNTRQFSFIQ